MSHEMGQDQQWSVFESKLQLILPQCIWVVVNDGVAANVVLHRKTPWPLSWTQLGNENCCDLLATGRVDGGCWLVSQAIGRRVAEFLGWKHRCTKSLDSTMTLWHTNSYLHTLHTENVSGQLFNQVCQVLFHSLSLWLLWVVCGFKD